MPPETNVVARESKCLRCIYKFRLCRRNWACLVSLLDKGIPAHDAANVLIDYNRGWKNAQRIDIVYLYKGLMYDDCRCPIYSPTYRMCA